ncbi:hypothetical protein INT48_009475 [Thamnidium elegans]|uniref:Uncharacterized protein n=1 Tax=Thamnidium elegans TaxID=101142 RepID=A0A8H7SJM6_9FUNG|nr:hypothetical protein INT48_009475 [Thamnidium elegans]
MVSNAVCFNTHIIADNVLDSAKRIITATAVVNLVNNTFVSSNITKEVTEAVSFHVSNVENISQGLIVFIKESVTSPEEINAFIRTEDCRNSAERVLLLCPDIACQLSFARRRNILSGDAKINLDLDDFNQKEFHGNNEIRRVSTREYYSYAGTLQRLKSQQHIKRRAALTHLRQDG